MSDPRTGGCLCGAVRYEIAGEPVFTLRCHCRDCQRQSGAAHVPAARVPSAGFRILQGIPKRYVTKADSGNDIVRIFCGDCGTPLYVQVGTRPDLIGLRVCTLDDASWFKPDADIFMKSAQPWDHDEPNVPKYDTYPRDNPTRPRRPAMDRHRILDARLWPTSVTPPISQQVLARAGLTEMGGKETFVRSCAGRRSLV